MGASAPVCQPQLVPSICEPQPATLLVSSQLLAGERCDVPNP